MSNNKKASGVNIDHAPTNTIPTTQIVADATKNVRVIVTGEEHDKKIKELAQNIKQMGLLQSLVVVPLAGKDAGKYRLVAGFRRHEAITKHLKWTTIPCKVVPLEAEADIIAAAWSENEQRQEMTPYEKARTAGRLNQEFGLSGSQIATKLGVGKGYINNLTRAARELLPEIADAWRDRDPVLSMPNVLAIAGFTRYMVTGAGKDARLVMLTGDALTQAETAQRVLFKALQQTKGKLAEAEKIAKQDPDFAKKAETRKGMSGAGENEPGAGENEPGAGGAGGDPKPQEKRLTRAEVDNLQDALNKAGNAGKLKKLDAWELATAILDLVQGRIKEIKLAGFAHDPTFKPAPEKKEKEGNGKGSEAAQA